MKMYEDNEQMALFRWAEYAAAKYPEISLMHHIPNGGARDKKTGAKLKLMGVKKGVPDIFLPCARRGAHGLYIELKYGKNGATAEQKMFIENVKKQGYAAIVCTGWEAAATAITAYLSGKEAEDINTLICDVENLLKHKNERKLEK